MFPNLESPDALGLQVPEAPNPAQVVLVAYGSCSPITAGTPKVGKITGLEPWVLQVFLELQLPGSFATSSWSRNIWVTHGWAKLLALGNSYGIDVCRWF